MKNEIQYLLIAFIISVFISIPAYCSRSDILVFLDTETTGLSVLDGHRIVEIAAIKVDSRTLEQIEEPFRTYINPQRPIDQKAAEINGLTDEILKDKPLFEDIADDFLSFIGDYSLVAHNAPFDIGFLNYELELIKREPLRNSYIDTLSMARRAFPGERVNLNALCTRFGIDNSKRKTHGALIDAEYLIEVYKDLRKCTKTEPTNLRKFHTQGLPWT